MLKQEGSPEHTFGVKNIQKSELRPLHKFEQELGLLCCKLCEIREFLKAIYPCTGDPVAADADCMQSFCMQT